MDERKRLELREDAATFRSGSQNARALTEDWVGRLMFCPNCTSDRLKQFPSNRPVADFFCPECAEEFEVKGQKSKFGPKVVDGAYATMVQRLRSETNPNLILLQYDRSRSLIRSAMVVPKQFFVPEVIQERRPLAETARRAGWVGCNILLDRIPELGKIFYVDQGLIHDAETVRSSWKKTLSLRDAIPSARGWLLQTWRIVERLPEASFRLEDVYAAEDELSAIFPANNNVRPKIRQQLQVLRDMGFIEFLGAGRYQRRSLN